eukprot:m.142669 g.142669  ORF g.142669 m.142669 type:complete len:424 (-) comp17144_c0_seq7:70-1341(-)
MSFNVAKHLVPGVGRMTSLVLSKGKGSWVWTDSGRKLLDFTCGIGVTNTGHSHPRVVKRVQEQASKLVHAQANISYHAPLVELVQSLLPVLPVGLDQLYFGTTGAEAVENAVKIARAATGRPNVIVFQGGFHGRTIATMGMTSSKTVYRAGMGPSMPGIHVVPYAYCLNCPSAPVGGACCNDPLRQLELAFQQQTAPSETAAVVLEPVLGEGGYVVPPVEFVQGVRRVCDEHDVLFVADEVQTGFGRTGKMFAVDHFGVTPDLLCMAKGLASGYPLAGVATTAKVAERLSPGSLGGTYSGNAVACAAAAETVAVINDEGLLENAVARGAELMQGLTELQAQGLPVRDVRGLGLMVGLEFDESMPKGFAGQVCQQCVNNGMLLLNASVYETIRFIPPLNVSAEEIATGVQIFDRSLREVLEQRQ